MVQGRLVYMVPRIPRVKGAKPGRLSVSRPARSAAVYSGLTAMPSGVAQVRPLASLPAISLLARARQSPSVGLLRSAIRSTFAALQCAVWERPGEGVKSAAADRIYRPGPPPAGPAAFV